MVCTVPSKAANGIKRGSVNARFNAPDREKPQTPLLKTSRIYRDAFERNLQNPERPFPVTPRRGRGMKRPLRIYDAVGVGAVVAMCAVALLVWYLKINQSPPTRVLFQVGYVRSCAHARELGIAPIFRGQSGYKPYLDADGDGIACELSSSQWLSSVLGDIWPSR